jgi:hypothetical protein
MAARSPATRLLSGTLNKRILLSESDLRSGVNEAKISGDRTFQDRYGVRPQLPNGFFFRDCFKNGFAGSDCSPSMAKALCFMAISSTTEVLP